MKQFPDVSARYGAPMGRHCVGDLDHSRRSVRLFKVRLNSGGYDDGGAYWGHGGSDGPVWAAIDKGGDMQTVRAWSRESAAFILGIPNAALAKRLNPAELDEYAYAMIDGRCPFPKGMDKADLFTWLAKVAA